MQGAIKNISTKSLILLLNPPISEQYLLVIFLKNVFFFFLSQWTTWDEINWLDKTE